jgi:hypothetical protein
MMGSRIDPKPVAYVLLWIVMLLSLLNTSLLGLHFYVGDSAPDRLSRALVSQSPKCALRRLAALSLDLTPATAGSMTSIPSRNYLRSAMSRLCSGGQVLMPVRKRMSAPL